MKKIMTKTAAVLSGILMLFAAVSAGPGLVFAAPVWYFYTKKKEDEA